MQRARKWTIYIGLGLVVLLSASVLVNNGRATIAAMFQSDPGFIEATQEGLGTSCPFGNNGPTGRVVNVASFINERGGVVLTQSVKDRLITLETQTMYQGRPRKTVWDVTTALSNTWLERVDQLTNGEIYEIGACTRAGIDAPSPPLVAVQGRFTSGDGALSQLSTNSMSEWMSMACAYRDASTSEAVAARAATPGEIYYMINGRMSLYEEALPGDWNRTMGLTPVQAFLISYSVVTDDWLYHSASGLTQMMQGMEAAIHQNYPGVQTSCLNRKAYGYMGYLYSTHAPYLFSETVQKRLIDRL